MNARLPQGSGTQFEQDGESRLEREKTLEQERADLSLDVHENNRPYAEKVERYIREGKADELRERMEKGEKPNEFSWMTLSAYMAVGAVGAIGAYKLTTWAKSLFESDEDDEDDEEDEDDEKKDKGVIEKGKELVSKAKKFPWGWGLGLLAATGFVFRGTFFEWMQKAFNFTTDNDSLKKFVDTIRKGPDHFKEAYDQLVYDTDEPFIEYFADELDIGKRHIAELQTVGYGHFLKQREKDSKKSYLTKGMEWAGLQMDDIPFTSMDDELLRVAEENRIADYIEKHKGELGLSDKELDKLTIGEIFEKFLVLKDPKRAEKGKKERVKEGKEKDPEDSDLSMITDDPENLEDPDSWDGIMRAATDIEGKDRKTYEQNLFTEISAAGGKIVNHPDLGTIIVKNGQGLLVSSIAIFGNDIPNALKIGVGFSEGDHGAVGEAFADSLETRWQNGGLAFLITGGVMGFGGALLRKENGTGAIVSTAGGAAKGFFLGPIGVLWNAFNLVKGSEKGVWQASAWIEDLKENYRGKTHFLQRLITRNPEKYKEVIKKQMLEEGRAYLKAYDRMQTAYLEHYRQGNVQKVVDFAIIQQDKHVPDHLKKIEELHFKRFASLWRTSKEILGLDPQDTRFPVDTLEYKDKRKNLVKMIGELEEELNPRVIRTNLTEEKTKLSDASLETRPVSEQVEELRKATKSADDFHRTAIEEYQEMKRNNATPEELQKKVDDTRKELTALREKMDPPLRRLTEASATMSPQDRKLVQDLLEQDLSKGMGLRAIKTEVKARGKWAFVLGVAEAVIATNELRETDPEAYAQMKTSELIQKVGPEVFQMICDVLSPFGLSDWASLIKGEAWFSGREMTGWDKLSAVVFGGYSLATDSLAVLGAGATAPAGGSGGAAIYGAGNLLEASLRTAGKSDDIIKIAREMIPEVASLANDVGGWKNLIKYLQNAKTITGGGAMAITGVNVARAGWAGLQIYFDTNGQKPIEMPMEETPDEVPSGGDQV